MELENAVKEEISKQFEVGTILYMLHVHKALLVIWQTEDIESVSISDVDQSEGDPLYQVHVYEIHVL